MAERRVTRRRILKTAAVMGVIGAVSSPGVAAADDDGDGRRYRWNIHVALGCGDQSNANANAKTRDGSRITMTGSGTFRDSRRSNTKVSGGGTWRVTGMGAGSGSYRVKEFLNFVLAPGGFPAGGPDCIGKSEDARAGLLHVKIRYSDGSEGVLAVSCRLPGTPDGGQVMEGIVVSKGFVEYWNMEDPNFTVFHVLRDGDRDEDRDDDRDD